MRLSTRGRQSTLLQSNIKVQLLQKMLIIKYFIKTLQMPSVIHLTLIFSCFSIRLSSLCQTTVGRGLPWAPQLRVSESPSRTSTKVGGVFINTGGARTKGAQMDGLFLLAFFKWDISTGQSEHLVDFLHSLQTSTVNEGILKVDNFSTNA